MKILVTGGTGFIGTHLCQHLAKAGHKVLAVDKKPFKITDILHPNITFMNLDLSYEDSPAMLLPEEFDIVYHLAAIPSVQYSIENPVPSHNANVNITLSLLEHFRQQDASNYKKARFVFMSSSSVYAEAFGYTPETWSTDPKTPYAVQKLVSEYYCNLYNRLYEMETVVPRLFNCYGPGQDGSSAYSGVISRFLDDCEKGRDFTIFGNGHQARDFVHVEDVCRALELLGTTEYDQLNKIDSATFNIANGKMTTVTNLCETIRKSMGREDLKINYGPARKEIFISAGDSSKLSEVTGWHPKITDLAKVDWKSFKS